MFLRVMGIIYSIFQAENRVTAFWLAGRRQWLVVLHVISASEKRCDNGLKRSVN